MKLSVEQANILDKIVEKSRMDCWFSITDDLTSIHDVETNRNISLRYGKQDASLHPVFIFYKYQ